MIRKIFLTAVLLALSGCAVTAEGPPFEKESSSLDNKATVYLYRPKLPAYSAPVLQPSIFINGNPRFRLPQQGYGVLHLDPGEYEFETRKEGNTISMEIESSQKISINSTDDLYIRWLPIHRSTQSYYNPVTVVTFVGDFGGLFEVIPEEIALKEITIMKKVYPK